MESKSSLRIVQLTESIFVHPLFKCSFTFQTIFHWIPHCCSQFLSTWCCSENYGWMTDVIKTLSKDNCFATVTRCIYLQMSVKNFHCVLRLTRSPLWRVNQSRWVAVLKKRTQTDSSEQRNSLDAAVLPPECCFFLTNWFKWSLKGNVWHEGQIVLFCRSNLMGTKFTVYDSGLNPVKSTTSLEASSLRQELAAICYVCMRLHIPPL